MPVKIPTGEVAPNRKRQRLEDSTVDRYIFLSCFDDPFSLVRADRRLLEQFACRLAKLIQHDSPHSYLTDVNGVATNPVYNINTSRPIICAFLKSLEIGEVSLPHSVDINEFTRFCSYEGISVVGSELSACSSTPKLKNATCLAPQTQPFAFARPAVSNVKNVETVMAIVAAAIAHWPRVCVALQDSSRGAVPNGYACNATSFLMRFAAKPTNLYSGLAASVDQVYALARRRPPWLLNTLCALGHLHYEMSMSKIIDTDARDEQSFIKLSNYRKNHPLGGFFAVKRDVPRAHRSEPVCNRPALRAGERFANHILNTVLEHGDSRAILHFETGDRERGNGGETQEYARAVILEAVETVEQTPCVDRMLSSACLADGDSKTLERKILEKQLKLHNLKILKWFDGGQNESTQSFSFPPNFYSPSSNEGTQALVEWTQASAIG